MPTADSFELKKPPPKAAKRSSFFSSPSAKDLARRTSRMFGKSKRKHSDGTKQVRLKGLPSDQDDVWLTEDQLIADCEKPTRNFEEIDCDKPRLGLLKIELLAMENVMRTDLLGSADPFCIFVFEDNFFKTPHIANCLSPMWPSESKRGGALWRAKKKLASEASEAAVYNNKTPFAGECVTKSGSLGQAAARSHKVFPYIALVTSCCCIFLRCAVARCFWGAPPPLTHPQPLSAIVALPLLYLTAVVLPITSPSSIIYVGAFDFDTINDDPLGRITIKLSSLRPNTQYDMLYPLQNSEFESLSGERGFIRLRVSYDFEGNDAKVLLACLRAIDSLTISTNERRLWVNILYTIHGKELGDAYNWAILESYVNELKEKLEAIKRPIERAVFDMVFWKRPLKSTFFFFAWQFIAVKPGYFPSFLMFLALLEVYELYSTNSRRRPPLQRMMAFHDMLLVLLGGGKLWKIPGINAAPEDSPFCEEKEVSFADHEVDEMLYGKEAGVLATTSSKEKPQADQTKEEKQQSSKVIKRKQRAKREWKRI